MDTTKVTCVGKTLSEILSKKYQVDFYQREYVWTKKQLEDLLGDLTNDFLKRWNDDSSLLDVQSFPPYFMGEIIISNKVRNLPAIIDGQQRITTLTLLLIFLYRKFGKLEDFPDELKGKIYSKSYGKYTFNLNVEDRKECMTALFESGVYKIKENDTFSVNNLVDRYNDIDELWDERIDNSNAVAFACWVIDNIMFSEVSTVDDDSAYIIFETMNDRGLSLTQVEMLRSYLLAHINDPEKRKLAMINFDTSVDRLKNIKLPSKSKAEFEFFKIYLRTHYAESFTQGKGVSDFERIGKEFHRWVHDNECKIGLDDGETYYGFIEKLQYFVSVYEKIHKIIESKDTDGFLYLVVNNDYGFTLQPALIIASIKYLDSDDVVERKIKCVSRYLARMLSWRVWQHNKISQSALESDIYRLCKEIRDSEYSELRKKLAEDPIEIPYSPEMPLLNSQNNKKYKVLLALITEIVARNSGKSGYLLKESDIQIEHIWADKFEEHEDECEDVGTFNTYRNLIGDLLLLPGSFNESYGDLPYEEKVQHYIEHNILAQSLNNQKYKHNPGFIRFIRQSELEFKAYEHFDTEAIEERTSLYRKILAWNWNNDVD